MLQTIGTHPTIAAALKYLSSCCDGANSQDGAGFNGTDTNFGKQLTVMSDRLSPNQQTAALKMLRKYQKTQLVKAHIILPTEQELKDFLDGKLDPESVKPLEKGNFGGFAISNPTVHGPTWIGTSHPSGVTHLTYNPITKEYGDFWFLPDEPLPWQDDNFEPMTGIEITSKMEAVEAEIEPEIELIKTPNGFTLNKQQTEAIHAMEEWWKSDEPWFVLKGYSGTGKSTTIQTFVKRLQKSDRVYVAMAAPTNKATAVLKRMATEAGLHNVEFATIYSLLGLKLQVNDDGIEKVVGDPTSEVSIANFDLVICDEASMINRDLYKMVCGFTRGGQPKVIFMGDPAQLPPVNETQSMIFTHMEEGCELTEVMRYGGAISTLVTEIRENLRRSYWQFSSDVNDDGRGVFLLDKWDWLDKLVGDFKSENYRLDGEYCRALAWTNKAVDWINDYVRGKIYGNHAAQFIEGERLIAVKPIKSPEGDSIAMPTSSECEILSCYQSDYQGYAAWRVTVVLDDGKRTSFWALAKESQQRFIESLEKFRNAAMEAERGSAESKKAWREFYRLKETFAAIAYSYATTTHKAQGSTFKNVYVATSDLLRNSKTAERNQLLYVAFSRASQNLYLSE